MSRPLRIEYPGATYHIMNRGWNRCPIFNDIGDRFIFFKTISASVSRFKLVRYIHMNGTKANLVSGPENDLYSSHRNYLNPQLSPDWLTTSTTLSLLNLDFDKARIQLHKFVKNEDQFQIDRIMNNPRWNEILFKVASAYGIPLGEICSRSNPQNSEARRAAMVLLRHFSLLPYSKIGALLGGITYGAVAPVCRKGEFRSDSFIKAKKSIIELINYQL